MSYVDDLDGPVGVGGWMYLFLIGFGFVSPLLLIWGTYSNLYGDPMLPLYFGESWSTYQTIEWIMAIASLAVIAFVVWRLFNVMNPLTVRITVIAIPALSLGLLFLDVMVTAWTLGIEAELLFAEVTTDILRSAIYCVIWCSYFLVSKRVKNTYYEAVADDVQEVFS